MGLWFIGRLMLRRDAFLHGDGLGQSLANPRRGNASIIVVSCRIRSRYSDECEYTKHNFCQSETVAKRTSTQ